MRSYTFKYQVAPYKKRGEFTDLHWKTREQTVLAPDRSSAFEAFFDKVKDMLSLSWQQHRINVIDCFYNGIPREEIKSPQ